MPPLIVTFLLSSGPFLCWYVGILDSPPTGGGATMVDHGGREGQQLGNYYLTHLLGQGSFADVYLGKHIYLDTQAAIKVLHGQLAGNEVEGFLCEARTVAPLRHPHIVQVLDFGVEGKTPFLVMDYAPGGSLRQRHPKGSQLPLVTVISYANQIAEALQYAHQEKLIHLYVRRFLLYHPPLNKWY